MAIILKGKEVVDKLNEELKARSDELKKSGITPTLGIIRLGERPDDLAYERGALTRAEKTGVAVRQFVYDADMNQDDLLHEIDKINEDPEISGVLMFRPLPPQIDDDVIRNELAPEKDMDGITDGSMAGVYSGNGSGYPPCTAEACIQILDHYMLFRAMGNQDRTWTV
jgi:methylenetetrahydrofolate dehydrogenase (NADP+)/methenyltetrahydrofolate cyclohydrolase